MQTAAKLILEPIFEADFEDCSYGFRPGRSAHEALQEIRGHLQAGYTEVYEADLQRYFDTLPHEKLMQCLEMRVSDRRMLNLIRQWLCAVIVEEDDHGKPRYRRSREGTPQGGVISPLLANIYLHWFDKVFHRNDGPAPWAKAKLVRYADDVRHITRCQIPFTERRGSEEQTFGSTAYPLAKAKRNNSMPLTQEGSEDVYDLVLQDPRNMVKTELFEAQSPGMKAYILRPQRLKAESSR